MNTEVCKSSCSWCQLSKERKGLIVGVLGAILIHGAALGVVKYLGGDRTEAKPRADVIYLGTITISPSKMRVDKSANKKLSADTNLVIALKRSI